MWLFVTFPLIIEQRRFAWWRHQRETFSASLAICAGNSPVNCPPQRPVTRSFDAFFDLSMNKRFNKKSWDWWFETPSRPLWCHCNVSNIHLLGGGACVFGVLLLLVAMPRLSSGQSYRMLQRDAWACLNVQWILVSWVPRKYLETGW